MRPLAEIVAANREAWKLGVKTTAEAPVGVKSEYRIGDTPVATPEEMKRLGLDKY